MKPIVTAGVVLAVIVGLLMFVQGFGGVYKNPNLGWLFPTLATLIELGVLIWGLKQTALQGRKYGGQVLAGVLIALVGGVLIVLISLAWSATFPDVFEHMEAMQADQLVDRGLSEEEIDTMLEQTALLRTPAMQAIFGFLGTMLTGLVLSLIIAIFVRSKEQTS